MAYASHNISKIYHLRNKSKLEARKSFKRRIKKSADKYNQQFRYIDIFNAITDDVFIMPQINHHDNTMLTYLSKPHIMEPLGWNSIEDN